MLYPQALSVERVTSIIDKSIEKLKMRSEPEVGLSGAEGAIDLDADSGLAPVSPLCVVSVCRREC